MAPKKSYIKPRSEYTVSYKSMHGVDFSSESYGSSQRRFSYLENMYRDYMGGGSEITESIPGFRKIASFPKKINAIYTYKNNENEEFAIIHSGNSLYRISLSELEGIYTGKPLIKIKDVKSHAFNFGSNIYVIDGENIVKIDSDGLAEKVGDDTGAAPYVPVTYLNGKEFEQRNLLTEKFREKYVIGAACDAAAASDGMKFTVTSSEEQTCSVSGISAEYAGPLYIPSRVNIGGADYKVTEISENAFSMNVNLTSVILSESIKKIGSLAFYGCTGITEVITRSSLEEIGNNAFLGCSALGRVFIGSGIRKIGAGAFGACPALKIIDYSLDAASFSHVEIQTPFENLTVNYGAKYVKTWVEIPVFSPAKSISNVTVGGHNAHYTEKYNNGLISSIIISSEDAGELDGKEAVIYGFQDPANFSKNTYGTNFLSENDVNLSGTEAILGCTVCECFDGRIFLSGNPKLPNTVFYSSRDESGRNNPLYFGILNYFNDGTGSFTVESMLAAGDSLAVFKSGDDGGGSIYYHTPLETGADILPKIYPVSFIHCGISAVGDSISFFDDPIFISALGVSALDKKRINLERSVAVRSHNVNARLLGEDLSKISLTEWCGYLVVMAKGNVYLADSRQTFTHKNGNVEYEWYYLTGIGTYRGEQKVFRYSSVANDGYLVHNDADEIISGEVYMDVLEGGKIVYYTRENGLKYEAYTSGEATGGEFSPSSCVCGTGNGLLFFGTEAGDVCVFNNDKRGEAPPWIKESADYDSEEYERIFGRRIHPYYYAFASHAPRYALTTPKDNGGFPNLTKNTVKNSLAIKTKNFGCGGFTFEVYNDKNGYREIARLPSASIDFSEIDFSSVSFFNTDSLTLPLKEKEKGWTEKEINLYSNAFASPFGIYSITFRFSIKGKIKN